MTLTVIRGLRECSEADRWAVVAAIRGIALEAQPQRVALALAALGACFEGEGRISKAVYAGWRERQPRPDEWPSTKAIADTFSKSWKRAMAAFGAEAVLDVLVGDFTRDTSRFTPDEVLANLQEYGKTGGPLSVDPYRVWAQDRMGDPQRRCARYVLSAKSVIDLFGSWEQALVAAGLGDRLSERRDDGRLPHRRGPAAEYTQERTAAWVARAFGADDADGPVPACGWTKEAFDLWAAGHELAELAEGRLVKVPRSPAVARLHEGWAGALFAAGLISEAERDLRAGHRTEFRPDEELVAAVAEALGRKATALSRRDYNRFRTRRGEVDGRKLPSEALIRTRLGWSEAVERAVTERDATTHASATPRRPPGMGSHATASPGATRRGAAAPSAADRSVDRAVRPEAA